MRGVKELRVKESDRIAAMADGLRACGVTVEDGPDWWIVEGRGPGGVPGGATCATHLDHRIAMSFLCLGLASQSPVGGRRRGPDRHVLPDLRAADAGTWGASRPGERDRRSCRQRKGHHRPRRGRAFRAGSSGYRPALPRRRQADAARGGARSRRRRGLTAEDLSDPDALRGPDVAQAARVAAIPEVRAALLDFQRAFARRAGGAVLDGRDIGTVICPDAEAKLFVTASSAIRAKRRFDELRARGTETSFEAVLADIEERDARDSGRSSAPLLRADDAVLIDTSDLGVDDAIAAAIRAVEAKRF
jgi:cytidylate kinase